MRQQLVPMPSPGQVAASLQNAGMTQSVPVVNKAPRMAHVDLLERPDQFDIVSGPEQSIDKVLVETVLDPQIGGIRPPGSTEKPAWCVDGRLQVLVVEYMAAEDHGLGLWLTLAAHGSVYKGPPVL